MDEIPATVIYRPEVGIREGDVYGAAEPEKSPSAKAEGRTVNRSTSTTYQPKEPDIKLRGYFYQCFGSGHQSLPKHARAYISACPMP